MSWTSRCASGLIAGPLSPPVTLAMRGRRVSASMAMPTKVFTAETASAPASRQARANATMSVTLGDSLMISGKSPMARRTAPVTRPVWAGSVAKWMPPSLTLGQETLSSSAASPSAPASRRAASTYSSTLPPSTLAMMVAPVARSGGSLSRRKASMPTFCKPMALSIPAGVS